jgi:serine/threonine-protein kinase RsbW
LSAYPQRYQLNLTSETENLELIREFVAKIAQKTGLKEIDVNKIELAVDEACANVIKHAYPEDAPSKPIQIRIEVNPGKMLIIVSDKGKGFDVKSVPAVDMNKYLAEMRVGGLGIYLIRNLMDEVEFTMNQGKNNEVRMIKYFENHAQKPGQ